MKKPFFREYFRILYIVYFLQLLNKRKVEELTENLPSHTQMNLSQFSDK